MINLASKKPVKDKGWVRPGATPFFAANVGKHFGVIFYCPLTTCDPGARGRCADLDGQVRPKVTVIGAEVKQLDEGQLVFLKSVCVKHRQETFFLQNWRRRMYKNKFRGGETNECN